VKTFDSTAMDEIVAGTAIVGGAVEIFSDPVFRAFSGYGLVQINGEEFTGIGDRLLVQQTSGAVGGAAQGIELSLSGVEPNVVDLLDAESIKQALCVLYRLVADGAGQTILDAQIFGRGRVDRVETEEVAGGTATIKLEIETSARGLGRRGGRMRTDPDQRLINPGDDAFEAVSYAGKKMLYWGGHGPQRAGGFSGALGNFFGGGFS
jgi:hypothetical protein